MRTISAKHEKGKEPRSRVWSNLRLLGYIAKVAWGYSIGGMKVRRKFARLQRSGGKFWVDE